MKKRFMTAVATALVAVMSVAAVAFATESPSASVTVNGATVDGEEVSTEFIRIVPHEVTQEVVPPDNHQMVLELHRLEASEYEVGEMIRVTFTVPNIPENAECFLYYRDSDMSARRVSFAPVVAAYGVRTVAAADWVKSDAVFNGDQVTVTLPNYAEFIITYELQAEAPGDDSTQAPTTDDGSTPTGDTALPILFAVLAAASFCGIVACVVLRRKKS